MVDSPGCQARPPLDAVVALVRAVCALMVVIMSVLFAPLSRPMALAIAAAALAYSAYAYRTAATRRARPAAPGTATRTAWASVVLDGTLAVAAYALFVRDPHAMPVVFLPLLVFELAAQSGARGLLAAGLAAGVALGARAYLQVYVLADGALRPPVLMLWLAVCALMAALALEMRVRERQYLAAVSERGRIAESFRATVSQVLARSGVQPGSTAFSEVEQALASVCGDQSLQQRQLTIRLAELITTARYDLGLTRREQEIAGLLAMGHSCQRIAAELLVSQSTVRNHIHRIKVKLGLDTREELIALLQQNAAVRGDPPAAAGGRRVGLAPAPPRLPYLSMLSPDGARD